MSKSIRLAESKTSAIPVTNKYAKLDDESEDESTPDEVNSKPHSKIIKLYWIKLDITSIKTLLNLRSLTHKNVKFNVNETSRVIHISSN